MRLLRSGGFTLIELLFIVAIIAVLAAIAVPNFLEAQVRAKSSRTSDDMAILGDALEAYALKTGAFPENLLTTDTLTESLLADNGWALKRLTTPVAYQTRIPILAYSIDRRGDDYLHRRPPDPFMYWRFDREKTEEGVVPHALLISPGPSGKLTSRVTSSELQLVHYDSTNGSKSGGDFYMMFPNNCKPYEKTPPVVVEEERPALGPPGPPPPP